MENIHVKLRTAGALSMHALVKQQIPDDYSDTEAESACAVALCLGEMLWTYGITTLADLDRALRAHSTLEQNETEPTPDDDAARDRMERSEHINLVYVDPDGTRWEIMSRTPLTAVCPVHQWSPYHRDEYDRKQRTCRHCGIVMAKSKIQT